jgi:ubiquinone/menaquinone biosynthesis C-methylase UbiE
MAEGITFGVSLGYPPMTEPQIASKVTRAISAQYDEFHASLEALVPLGEQQNYLNYGYRDSAGQGYEETQAQLCLEVFRAAEIVPSDVIIDVGFGGGEQSLLLAANFEFARYTGFNISANQVRYATERASQRNLSQKLAYRLGEAEELPGVAAGSVDKLMAVECAFYFDRPRFYRCAAEVLKPGGRAVLADITLCNALGFLGSLREDFRRVGTRGTNRREWEKYLVTRSIRDINPQTRPGVQRTVFRIFRLSRVARMTPLQRREWWKMAFYTQLIAIGQLLGLVRYELIVLEKRQAGAT